MAGLPSMGDVLMLSHTAKSIGKVFGIRSPGAPQDFFEVDRETQGLADALKLLAYTFEEDHLIPQSERSVQQGIFTILASAQITLKDLAAFVERYSTYQKGPSRGVNSEDKVWTQAVLEDWRTLPWTRDGGDILALRSLLMMHCTTVTLTTQALQSHSIDRLEQTVLPLASKLEGIHDDIPGRLNHQLQELHQITMDLVNQQRSAYLAKHDEQLSPHVHDFDMPTPTSPTQLNLPNRLGLLSFEKSGVVPQNHVPTQKPTRRSSSRNQPRDDSRHTRDSSLTQLYVEKDDGGWKVRKRPSSQFSMYQEDPRPQSAMSYRTVNSKRSRSVDERPKSRLLGLRGGSRERPQTFLDTSEGSSEASLGAVPPTPRRLQKKRPHISHRKSTSVPNEGIPYPHMAIPARDDFTHVTPRSTSTVHVNPEYRKEPAPSLPTPPRSRSGTRKSLDAPLPEPTFIETLLRDSVNVFNDHATSVEIAPADNEVQRGHTASFNTTISEACRVLILRRKDEQGMGPASWSTSIWIISSDSIVRLEQPLPNVPEARSIAPHVSWLAPEKVILTMETRINHHSPKDDSPQISQSTCLLARRVTYTFASQRASEDFQSAIFGHTLLDNFRIERVTLIRPGGGRQILSNILGIEELMCGRQRLRLWQDEGTTMPTSSVGGVTALMHLQPSFGQGWIKWWVNSARVSQIKSKGQCAVEIRGIDCMVDGPVNEPIYALDSFTQCSVIAGQVPSKPSQEEMFLYRPSYDRPDTAMTDRSDRAASRLSHSRTPSMGTLQSTHTTKSKDNATAFRLPFSLKNRRSRSRSTSSNRSRSNSETPIPFDADEPMPPPPRLDRRDSGNDSNSVGSGVSGLEESTPKLSPSPSNALSPASFPTPMMTVPPPLPTPRAGSALALLPPLAPGSKWNTPISPRPTKQERKPTESPPPPPLPSKQIKPAEPERPTSNSRHARAESRSEYRSEARADPRHETRAEHRHEARAEPRYEARPDPRLETRPEPRPEARPDPRHEARAESRLDAHRPLPRPDTNRSADPELEPFRPELQIIDYTNRPDSRAPTLVAPPPPLPPPTNAVPDFEGPAFASAGLPKLSTARSGWQPPPPSSKKKVLRGGGKRRVHGVKIYFSNEDEKRRFLRAVERARQTMLALPEC